MADRVEREIEEILRKIDDFVPERSRHQVKRASQPFTAAQGWFSKRLARISMNQVMGWSLILALVSYLFLRGMPIGTWMLIGSLIVFVTAFVVTRLGGGSSQPQVEKRWRGERLDLSGPSLPDRVKAWIRGRKHS